LPTLRYGRAQHDKSANSIPVCGADKTNTSEIVVGDIRGEAMAQHGGGQSSGQSVVEHEAGYHHKSPTNQ